MESEDEAGKPRFFPNPSTYSDTQAATHYTIQQVVYVPILRIFFSKPGTFFLSTHRTPKFCKLIKLSVRFPFADVHNMWMRVLCMPFGSCRLYIARKLYGEFSAN